MIAQNRLNVKKMEIFMKKFDVIAIGECLVDMIPCGVGESGVSIFSANPGGAPANVLAMYSKLGGKTAFIGKVGRDGFGKSLIQNMKNANIDTDNVIITTDCNTTLAFVHLSAEGDRSFSFYRKGSADVSLNIDEIDKDVLGNCSLFHFGSVSMTDEPSRSATLESVKIAKQNGAVISYDPNYRPLLWDDRQTAAAWMLEGARLADVIKVSDEELTLLTGESDYLKGAQKLLSLGVSLVFVTLGKHGAFYCNKNTHGLLKTYDVKTIDTTGAGDTFFGSVLWQLKGKTAEEMAALTDTELQTITDFANAAGSLATTKKGAIPAMPTLDEVKTLTCRQ